MRPLIQTVFEVKLMHLDKNIHHFPIISKIIHVLTAFLCFMAFIAAYRALRTPALNIELLELHYYIGILVLLLSVARLIVIRLLGKPKAIGSPIAKLAAYMGHYALYAVIFLIPLTGITLVAAKCKSIYLFGFPLILGFPERTTWLINFSSQSHQVLVWGSVLLLGVHVSASFYHHFILKDITLIRMLGACK